MTSLRDLPSYWPYLLALYQNDREVKGAVTLQKLVSCYEVAGIPLPTRFTVIDMGQVDKKRKENLETAINSKTMGSDEETITLKTTYTELQRHDYYIQPKGVEIVENEILPALLEYSSKLKRALEITKSFKNKSSKLASENAHEIFLTHDPRRFEVQLDSSRKELQQIIEEFPKPQTPEDLDTMGLAEFSLRALDKIKNEKVIRRSSDFGKYEIVFNAPHLVKYLKSSDYANSILVGEAIEYQATAYRILNSFNDAAFDLREHLTPDESKWLTKQIKENILQF